MAAFEFLGEVRLHLTAAVVGAGGAHAFAAAEKATNVEAEAGRNRRAVIELRARGVEVEAIGERERAARVFAVFRNHIDDATGGVGSEYRRAAAAHGLDVADRGIGAEEHVGVAEGDVAELDDGEPVFVELHVARTAVSEREAADGEVGVTFTGGGFDADTGQRAEELGGVAGREEVELVHRQQADGDGGLELGFVGPRDSGDDEAIELQDFGSGFGRGRGRSFGNRRGRGFLRDERRGGERHGGGNAAKENEQGRFHQGKGWGVAARPEK